MAKNDELAMTDGFEMMTGGALQGFGFGADLEDEMYLGDGELTGLPRLRLAQGLSPEVSDGLAKPGDWVLEGHEPNKTVDLLVVPGGRYANRLRLSKGAGRGEILCRADRVKVTKPIELLPLHGIGDPGIECAECPFAKWTPRDDGSGKNNPPECLLIHTFEVISLTHGVKAEIQFKKTSEGIARSMVKAMADHGGPAKTLFQFSQEKKQNAAGQPYFVPVFKVIEPQKGHFARFKAIQASL